MSFSFGWGLSKSVEMSGAVCCVVFEGPVDVEVASVVLPRSGARVAVLWVFKVGFG